MFPVIVYYMHLRAKNQKSKYGFGDLQADYHQLKKSHAQTLDATIPKDSTHSDNQSNTVSQESDRRRFFKRGVRRIF